MTLKVSSPKVYTMQGVPLSVTGIAQIKIQGHNDEMLRASLSINCSTAALSISS